ncbi:hypothetical protein Snoj_46260 [Streptomyces nojiriensis]|uniref:Uncharacterized protein n=1 Tax=Streptomyces nojiriensis TaxID=66374 RepID=A0ABQ3SRD7_9ACTN|nr:hypothetical protein [Streptomyces nojiriensis]QTI44265.1 hypothetical protein JYK04_02032 [Streptomyces nojiriensis]GGS37110.1 hypothetical protein GCM10010205_78890 [Streptomyces nojiriensis]GHI70708.1 hypothetical protein Snoj_46260 [Streptomyces nojiriensis]
MNSRPSGFEDRLKAALLARLPEAVPAPPARSFARRYGIPLAVGVATATVVAVMTLTGSSRTGSLPAGTPSRSASAAPEITKEPDGSLRFDPPEQAQVPALADRLKELGVRAVAVPMLPASQCKTLRGWERGPQADPAAGVSRSDDGRTLKVNPKAVPPGHTLLVTWAYFQPLWEAKQGLAFGIVEDEDVPYCSVDYTDAVREAQRLGPPTRTPGPPATITPSP